MTDRDEPDLANRACREVLLQPAVEVQRVLAARNLAVDDQVAVEH